MLENQSMNELFRLFFSQGRVETRIISELNIRSPLGLGGICIIRMFLAYVPSALELIPSGSSPEVLSKSRPTSLDSVSVSSLVASESSKKRCICLVFQRTRKQVMTTPSYSRKHSLH